MMIGDCEYVLEGEKLMYHGLCIYTYSESHLSIGPDYESRIDNVMTFTEWCLYDPNYPVKLLIDGKLYDVNGSMVWPLPELSVDGKTIGHIHSVYYITTGKTEKTIKWL